MATAIINGQTTVAATRAALSTTKECNWLILRSIKSNAEMAIGNSSVTLANGFILLPGEAVKLGTCDLLDVNVIGTADDTLFWIASYTG